MNLPIAPEPLPQARECCPTSTRKRIEFKHAVLVDVRERDEVEKLALDVPEIVNIPLSEFERRFRELPRDRELVLVSSDGQDSLKATYYLMREGYTDVLNMTHGIAKWVLRGFPIKGDTESLVDIADSQSCCSTPSVASG